jgi:hypothetical protein
MRAGFLGHDGGWCAHQASQQQCKYDFVQHAKFSVVMIVQYCILLKARGMPNFFLNKFNGLLFSRSPRPQATIYIGASRKINALFLCGAGSDLCCYTPADHWSPT